MFFAADQNFLHLFFVTLSLPKIELSNVLNKKIIDILCSIPLALKSFKLRAILSLKNQQKNFGHQLY